MKGGGEGERQELKSCCVDNRVILERPGVNTRMTSCTRMAKSALVRRPVLCRGAVCAELVLAGFERSAGRVSSLFRRGLDSGGFAALLSGR